MKYLFAALFLITVPAFAAIDVKQVKLQILNKIDAKETEVITDIDKKFIFEDLEIKLRRCIKSGVQEKKENLALIEIYDIAKDTPREQAFYGWMFSSSPALSAMEHPIYDVIVLECIK